MSFKMSQSQQHMFWRMWGAACKAQRWDKLTSAARDEKRLAVLAECGFDSAKDIDKTRGYDRVKSKLLELAGEVPRPIPGRDASPRRPSDSEDDKDSGRRTRLLHACGERVQALIDLKGEPWALRVLKDRFKLISGWHSIIDLSDEDLVNLLRTVNTRIASHQTLPATEVTCA